MNYRNFQIGLAVVSLLAVSGCKKGPALEELKKVEEACTAKDKARAVDIAVAAAESNSAFKNAFEAVFASVPDKTVANVCGALNLIEMKSRIENGPLF